jgi:uncharacterized membrane protein
MGGDVTHAAAFVRAVAPWLVHITEACAVVTVFYGVVRSFAAFALSVIREPTGTIPRTRTRLTLGRSLALALEFLLAADILNSITEPSLQNLAVLGGVAVIRTGLNYFLSQELEQEEREEAEKARDRTASAQPATSAKGG